MYGYVVYTLSFLGHEYDPAQWTTYRCPLECGEIGLRLTGQPIHLKKNLLMRFSQKDICEHVIVPNANFFR